MEMITGRGVNLADPKIDTLRLDIAIELANAPPVDRWPPKHLKNFRALLGVFFRFGSQSPRTPPEEYSVGAIAELKAWTEAQFGGFLGVPGRIVVGLDASATPLVLEIVRDKATGVARVGRMRGPISGVWELGVALLLASEAGERLRRCPDAKCARYFLRTGKQEHCSVKCARRVYMRAYRVLSGLPTVSRSTVNGKRKS